MEETKKKVIKTLSKEAISLIDRIINIFEKTFNTTPRNLKELRSKVEDEKWWEELGNENHYSKNIKQKCKNCGETTKDSLAEELELCQECWEEECEKDLWREIKKLKIYLFE